MKFCSVISGMLWDTTLSAACSLGMFHHVSPCPTTFRTSRHINLCEFCAPAPAPFLHFFGIALRGLSFLGTTQRHGRLGVSRALKAFPRVLAESLLSCPRRRPWGPFEPCRCQPSHLVVLAIGVSQVQIIPLTRVAAVTVVVAIAQEAAENAVLGVEDRQVLMRHHLVTLWCQIQCP